MTIFPEFEQELRRIARQTAEASDTHPRARRAPRLRRSRKAIAMLPAAASIAVAVAVAVIAIAAVGHHPGGVQRNVAADPGQRQEFRYLQNANRRAARTAACRNDGQPLPSVTNGSPSKSLLRVLGVLRRPAGTADALPQSLRGEHHSVSDIYLRYVRLALVKDGVTYYVAPVASLAPSREASPACYQAHRAALNAELPRIPLSARAATLALENRQIAGSQRLEAQQRRGGVCLLTESRYVEDGACGASASIAQQGMLIDYGLLSGIVPDGVATVTARYAPTRTSRAHVVTTTVVGNVFATSLTIPHNTVDLQPTLIWRSADGTILKTIPASDRKLGAGSGFCGGREALRHRPTLHICAS